MTSVTIPDNVTNIGSEAFSGCSNLRSITIPESVTSIGKDAFHSCSSLNSVHISSIDAWLNLNFDSVTSTSNPCYNGASIYLNNELLTELIIPDSVTKIGSYALQGCSSLTSVTIPNSVTSIGYYAFQGCSSLKTVTISNSVTSIGEDAFCFCSRLTNIAIPDSITSIGKDAFLACSSLKRVYYAGKATDWASISIGSNNSSLTYAIRYYSETQPTDNSYNYWHYVDGVPTEW